MKKLFIAALLVVGMTSFAQEGSKEKMTSQQRNELQLKKLTLELGLKESQQKEMSVLIADQTAKREAAMAERKANKQKGIELTADERFKKESQMLDEKIALKDKVKKILTAEQFTKWEQMNADKKDRMKDHMEKRGKKDRGEVKE